MAPKSKQAQHKAPANVKAPHVSVTQINQQMNAKQKKMYSALFSGVDNRKYEEVYVCACELLQAFPEHTDVLGFKGHAIYHMPSERIEVVSADFNETEAKMLSKPQYALQVCGMRIMQQAAKMAVNDTHLPLQLLANTQKQLGCYQEAMQLFDQILKLPAWQANPNFAKERAICAVFCHSPNMSDYLLKAQKLADKQTKVFCDNCAQLYCEASQQDAKYFEEAKHEIHKSNLELRKKEEPDFELAELSQLELYRISLIKDEVMQLKELEENSAAILDLELVNKLKEDLYLRLIYSKPNSIDKSYVDLLYQTIESQLARNPDETEQVSALLACLLLRTQDDAFLLGNKDQIISFAVLSLIPDSLLENAIDIVKAQQLSQFQKTYMLVKLTKERENEYFAELIRAHFKVNNAQSLNMLEKLVDVSQHLPFILAIVKEYLATKPAKRMFCEAFLAKYTTVSSEELLGLFSCRRYVQNATDFDLAHVELSDVVYQREFAVCASSLMKTYANERFEDQVEQDYWQAHNQQVIQELMLLGEVLTANDAKIGALELAITLDARDRFLNVRLTEKYALAGQQYNALQRYQGFIARTNVLFTALDVQELNVMFKLALAPPSQSVLHYVLAPLDYAENAKNSEKITNPRMPLPQPEFTEEEIGLVGDDEFCCKILQFKVLSTLLATFQEQQNDCQELLYVAGWHYQLAGYSKLLQTYPEMLLRRSEVQQVVAAFQEMVHYFGAMPKEQLSANIEKYQGLFQKLQQKLWAHHTMLDSADYERMVDYNPFCFDELRQLSEKGKMRLGKKIQKFLTKVGTFESEFVY